MGAPKGNQFWKLRSKHGRDKIFASPAIMWAAACEYFEWCDKHPFIEMEQVKQVGKPYYDGDKEKWIAPERTVGLPRKRPYTIQGICLYLCTNVRYFNDFEKRLIGKNTDEAKDFSTVITNIRETIYDNKFTGAAAGFFNANIIARDLGLADKQETKHSGGITQTIVSPEEARKIAADLEKDL